MFASARGVRSPQAATLDNEAQVLGMFLQSFEEALLQSISSILCSEAVVDAKPLLFLGRKTGKLCLKLLCIHRHRDCWKKSLRDEDGCCLRVVVNLRQVPFQEHLSCFVTVQGRENVPSSKVEHIWVAGRKQLAKALIGLTKQLEKVFRAV